MNLGISTAFGHPYRLRLGPPLSTGRASVDFHVARVQCYLVGAADYPTTASNIFCQTPFSLQRAKRL